MASSSQPGLSEALSAIAEDAVFGLCAIRRPDFDVLRALASRRAPVYEKAALGEGKVGIHSFPAWVLELCAAIAPIHPPSWMPMAEVIEKGLSLSGGARGVRSLFTSKPSEKEIERVSRQGAFMLRALTAVLGSDGPLSDDERLVRDALLASMALPEQQERLLRAEGPMPIEALEIPEDLDAKLIRGLVRGAWIASARDGLDPHEETATLALARRLRCLSADVESLRSEALASLERDHAVGLAAVDALRFLLAESPAESKPLIEAALRLLLPPMHLQEPLAALSQDAKVTLARRHRLDREGKAHVLALTWIAALRDDPALTRRIELVALHETIAEDLDAGGAGSAVREDVDAFVEAELLGAASRRVEG